MVISRDAYLAFLGLLALERGVELVVSSRNVRRLLARGGAEAGRGHYRPMVIFHTAFLLACAGEAVAYPAPAPAAALAALAGAVLAQGLRWWAIATLGERWTTRVVVLPGEPLVTGGPYRYLRHPNYLAVVLEMALVPLAFGSWRTAVAFSLGNAVLLRVRIRAEERALGMPGLRPPLPAPLPSSERGRGLPSSVAEAGEPGGSA